MPRWSAWAVVAIPALLGLASLVAGTGDLRTSGLMAGMALTIAGCAALLLLRGRWRRARGIRRAVLLLPVVILGLIGLGGLAAGIPEFAQARFGLFVPTDAFGPRMLAVLDDAFVVVSDEREGVAVLRSDDGRTWTRDRDVSALEGLRVADAVVADGEVLAVAQPTDGDVAHVLTSGDGRTWRAAAQFGPDAGFGIAPSAIAATDGGFVAVAGIYGNDAAFFHSTDGRAWTVGAPAPVFDDHEGADDVACTATGCVAIGERYTSRGITGGTRRAIAWTSSSQRDPWVQADGVFGAARVTAVASFDDTFVAGGHDPAEDRATLWTSPDGRVWTPVGDDPDFRGAVIDGLADLDGAIVAFGRDHGSGDVIVWTSDDALTWQRSTVEDGGTAGSHIRAMANNGATTVAVGIDTSDNSTAVWTSDDFGAWRRAPVGDRSS